MTKVNIRRLDSVTNNDTTATELINENFQALQTAIENTLSRDGTTPNFIDANIDLNSYKLINGGEAVDDNDYITLKQFNEKSGDAVTAAATAQAAAVQAQTSAQAAATAVNDAVGTVTQGIADIETYVTGTAEPAIDNYVTNTIEPAIDNYVDLAKDWATKTGATVDGSEYSSKYYADLSHKWATSNTVVESGQYGASYYALRAYNANVSAQDAKETAKDWATKTDGTVDGIDYSAKYYAQQILPLATDIATVNANATNITTVAGISSDVTAVAGISSNVTTVAGNTTNITTVAGVSSDVTTVATNISAVNTAASNISAITDAPTYAAAAKQWAIGDPSEPTGNSAKYWAQQAAGQVIPSQTGHSGEFLTTDGSSMSWNAVDALPSQTGQSGKFLSTDGTDASWATLNVNPDNESITTNASDELQTVGVINQNDTTTALKVWHGTQAEYDALATHDANTRYYTDGGLSVTLLDVIYPVGSIYITTNSSCPLSTLIAGSTWTLVGQDRVLQGAGTRGVVGATLNESLPNITGTYTNANLRAYGATTTGCFSSANSGQTAQDGSYTGTKLTFDASSSSSTYQDNAPVQPDAYLVNIYRRIS